MFLEKKNQIYFLSVGVSFVSLIKLSAHTKTNSIKLFLSLGGLRAVKSQRIKHLNKTILQPVCIEPLIFILHLYEIFFKRWSLKSKYLTGRFFLFPPFLIFSLFPEYIVLFKYLTRQTVLSLNLNSGKRALEKVTRLSFKWKGHTSGLLLHFHDKDCIWHLIPNIFQEI